MMVLRRGLAADHTGLSILSSSTTPWNPRDKRVFFAFWSWLKAGAKGASSATLEPCWINI